MRRVKRLLKTARRLIYDGSFFNEKPFDFLEPRGKSRNVATSLAVVQLMEVGRTYRTLWAECDKWAKCAFVRGDNNRGTA